MKEKIKEVKDYFKQRLLSGDFIAESGDKYTITVVIDGEYKFVIWVSTFGSGTQLWQGSFMDFELTKEEKETLNEKVVNDYEELRKQAEIAEKQKQFEQLKKELGL